MASRRTRITHIDQNAIPEIRVSAIEARLREGARRDAAARRTEWQVSFRFWSRVITTIVECLPLRYPTEGAAWEGERLFVLKRYAKDQISDNDPWRVDAHGPPPGFAHHGTVGRPKTDFVSRVS